MSALLTSGLIALETTPDASVVQPGIIPLIMLIVLAGIVVLLYRSMRTQLRRIDANQLPHDPRAPKTTAAQPRPDSPDIDIRHPAP